MKHTFLPEKKTETYSKRAHSFADNFEASVFVGASAALLRATTPHPPLQAKTMLWRTLKSVL